MLAKSGYTVFPLVPLPSPQSPPTSGPLSSLLLQWSTIQKRVRNRNPSHPGAVVPLIVDPSENDSLSWTPSHPMKASNAERRYAHAGETIKAYCRDNQLTLMAVICASEDPTRPTQLSPATITWPVAKKARFRDQADDGVRLRLPSAKPYHDNPMRDNALVGNPPAGAPIPSGPPITRIPAPSMSLANEQTLLALYRSTILEPLAVINEVSEQLSASSQSGRGRGRVVFVNTDPVSHNGDKTGNYFAGKVIGAARSEAAKLLRGQMGPHGIDVCEVVVGECARTCMGSDAHFSPKGPLAPRLHPKLGYHLRRISDESDDSETGRQRLLKGDNEEYLPKSILLHRICLTYGSQFQHQRTGTGRRTAK